MNDNLFDSAGSTGKKCKDTRVLANYTIFEATETNRYIITVVPTRKMTSSGCEHMKCKCKSDRMATYMEKLTVRVSSCRTLDHYVGIS